MLLGDQTLSSTEPRSLAAPALAIGLALALVAAAILVAPVSTAALVGIGLGLVALAGYATVRWPRAIIVVVVLAPILDRYIVSGLLPPEVVQLAQFLSEGLLLVVGVTLAVRAWRSGTLAPALRHPVTYLLGAFVVLGAVSALLNGVPPHVAAIGLLFTLDAAVLFFLPRFVGFGRRQQVRAVAAVLVVIGAAAVVVLVQAVLSPDILGLRFVTGRFGEGYRLAGFIGDPNVFGAFAAAASPFVLLAIPRSSGRLRWIAVAAAFLLLLALWLSFSRGAWLAMAIGTLGTLLLIDRRALLIALLLLVATFVSSQVMPRNLLLPTADGGPERPSLIESTVDRAGTVGQGRDLRTLFVLNAIPIVVDHPLLGVGPGRFGGAVADRFPTPVYAEYGTDALLTDETQRTVDNFWLHLLVEAGALGLAAFLAAMLSAAIPMLRTARRSTGARAVLVGGALAAVAALSVSGVSTMLLEANSVGFLVWFLLGLGSLMVVDEAIEAPA
ncbi:MAG TPA: O-antigen ligase family protein [Candidatus Limnocylindria bacterium]|nr:O-antigen ligase family protein [Candidatus Limnocylindria bacterium]